MIEDPDMYDGLEARPDGLEALPNTSYCPGCYTCGRCSAIFRSNIDQSGSCVVGHVLRVSIRNGGVDSTVRDEVLALLYRSFIQITLGDERWETTVGAGLAAAHTKGLRVRDPRLGVALVPDVHESEMFSFSLWKPFKVCPKWADPVDCVLDIPTFLSAATTPCVCGPLASTHTSTIFLDVQEPLHTYIRCGRVKTTFGFGRRYMEVPPLFSPTPFRLRLSTVYTKLPRDAIVGWSPGRRSFEYCLRADHIPEKLVVHYAGNDDMSIATIDLRGCFTGLEDETRVIECSTMLVEGSGNTGTVCVFDLHELFDAPPTRVVMMLSYMNASFLCSLLLCAEVAPEEADQ